MGRNSPRLVVFPESTYTISPLTLRCVPVALLSMFCSWGQAQKHGEIRSIPRG